MIFGSLSTRPQDKWQTGTEMQKEKNNKNKLIQKPKHGYRGENPRNKQMWIYGEKTGRGFLFLTHSCLDTSCL